MRRQPLKKELQERLQRAVMFNQLDLLLIDPVDREAWVKAPGFVPVHEYAPGMLALKGAVGFVGSCRLVMRGACW